MHRSPKIFFTLSKRERIRQAAIPQNEANIFKLAFFSNLLMKGAAAG
jgi:hypothetical protein